MKTAADWTGSQLHKTAWAARRPRRLTRVQCPLRRAVHPLIARKDACPADRGTRAWARGYPCTFLQYPSMGSRVPAYQRPVPEYGLGGTRVPSSSTRAWAREYLCMDAGYPPIRMKLLLYGPGVRRPDAAGARVQELSLKNLDQLVVHQPVPPVSWTASHYIRLLQCPERGETTASSQKP